MAHVTLTPTVEPVVPAPPAGPPWRRRLPRIGLIAAILLVAAALRLVWIDRYPLGWHHDEALMGVMAGQVYRGEDRPIFFQQYLGQEPLYLYLAAGAIGLLGGDEGYLPLRLTSAVVGIATVGVTLAVGRALFGAAVGLTASALIATSFWQVMSARMAYRSITQPLLEGIAVWLLWRLRARGGWGWAVGAGAALGATFYTYLGARAFPGVFAGFALWWLLTRGRPSRAALQTAAIVAGAALIVFLPLAIFFLTHPGTFGARMEQVFVFQPEVHGGRPWELVADSAGKMFRGFTVSGEPMWRYNIPGRPIFVGALGLAFLGGLIVLARRVFRRDDASALGLIWLAAMLFPGLLSWESGAYTLRAMGLVPALFIVPAVGLVAGARWVAGRRPSLGRAAIAAIVLVIAIDLGLTVRDYFVVWAPSFGASAEGHTDAVAQARFLVAEARPENEDIFVAGEYYHSPILAQLARPVYPALRWFDGRLSVAYSPESDRPALYVLAFNGLPPDLDGLFPRSSSIGSEPFPAGVDGGPPPPLFVAYRLTPDQVRAQVRRLIDDPRQRPIAGRIPDVLTPLGGRIDGPGRAASTLPVTFLWRVDGAPPPGEYQMLAHLIDHQQRKVAGHDALGYPIGEWRSGDVVWSRFNLPIPADLPPGRYQVQIALYDLRSGQRLPVADSETGGPAFGLGDVRVLADPPAAPTRPIGVRFGAEPAIELIGAEAPARTGEDLTVALQWRAERPAVEDYTVFVQLLDPAGRLIAQSDSFPGGGALPTSAWLPGEIVRDVHRLRLPADLASGQYRLIAGLYRLQTGQRLPATGGADHVEVGILER